jgi:hypothetical protein
MDRTGVETELLADHDEGMSIGVETFGSFDCVRRHLHLSATNSDAFTLQVLRDGVPVDVALTGEFKR